jgi:hypothetical protein
MSKDIKNYDNSNSCFSTQQASSLFNLSDFGCKNAQVRFDLEETFSDGGLLLLKEVDNQIGLINRLSDCLYDTCHQNYVKHSVDSMLRQRVMQIASGYEDAIDCNILKEYRILEVCANLQPN